MKYYMNYSILSTEYSGAAFEKAICQYKKELSDNFSDYITKIEDFEDFLDSSKYRDTFLKDLEEVRKCEATLEYVAIDYSIPVILVKYYLSKME